ncbi:hypothetical protein SAMN05216404_105109 [Nitrosospira multiformis]|uniref:LPP20 lipoprotein n=1 Tax=Nitrosospira multiformis TaxID=1231 RepID=A0A1H8HFG5_9PROT|nr:hypothetical protein [Nitrosospira multiformis]SEN54328.1 hypothetical protein SAMN05216404_105109 [Nitrosospira multiformis]
MRYKKLAKALLASVFIALISGCGSTSVVGRYKECRDQRGNACKKKIPEVDVSVVFSPAQKPATKTGADLTERAQAAYISALSQKSKTVDDLRKNFDSRIGNGVESALRNVASFEGALIITVSEVGPFNPADRLERTEVEIKLDQVRIRSWSAVQTAYSTVNAGTIQSSLQRGAEVGLSAPPNLPVGITGKTTIQAGRSEQLVASVRIDDVTPLFDPINGSIKIVRHGGFGLNLTGNTILHATFEPKPEYTAYPELFSVTTTDENGWLAPDRLKLNIQTSKLPRGMSDITGTITLTYIIRHVVKGDKTYQEGDDIVKMITDKKVQEDIILIPAEKIQQQTFGLKSAAGDFVGQPVYIKRSQRVDDAPLCFDDYRSAQDFLDYLNRPDAVSLETVGTARIGFVNFKGPHLPLIPLNLKLVKTLSVQPMCQPG